MNKQQLALAYFPNAKSPATAVRHLMRWITKCKPLHQQLIQLGYTPYAKTFSPRQTQLIIDYLGDP